MVHNNRNEKQKVFDTLWNALWCFNNLIEELTPFLKSKCINLVRSQLEIKKIVVIVLYRFVHGFNPKHMSNKFDVGAYTIF